MYHGLVSAVSACCPVLRIAVADIIGGLFSAGIIGRRFRHVSACIAANDRKNMLLYMVRLYMPLLACFLPVSGVFSVPAYICTLLINLPKIGVKTIFL